ncbi:hypothetical protein [Escherichia coli]|uniref:hypothetical protein n=1 Tax=Escherichia coli TaxID=562 RepID=UPI000B7E3A33|nr:hypothetical protein [Escherichia coli]
MNIALIKNDIVVNTIICESVEMATELHQDFFVVDIDGIDAGIGWSYDGLVFTAPVIVKTPEEIAAENLGTAQAEYDSVSLRIMALNEQIQDADWDCTTEDAVRAELASQTDYRKLLRAYLKAADGSQKLPPASFK